MKRGILLGSILLLALFSPAAAVGINSSISVDAGETVDDDLSTVNGRISIGDDAIVNGDAKTVNGRVEVGRNVQVESVATVNGRVEIGEDTIVDGDVDSVNGRVRMEFGSRARTVGTVNGPVELNGAEVERDVTTYNGDVILRQGSEVGGDIRIEKVKGSKHDRREPLKIYIEDGSSVGGDVIVEDERMKVEVYLRGGTVAGEIRGAKVVEG